MTMLFNPTIMQRIAGIVWLALGLTAVLLATGIQKPGFGSNQDPGPQFFPILLGAILAVGGCILLFKSFYSETTQIESSRGPSNHGTLLLFVLGFVFYLLAMPWLGFSVASSVFIFLMIWLQGSRWFFAMPVALGLVTGVQILFGYLFHVQLPSGVLSLPF
jgi:hypothetical protein